MKCEYCGKEIKHLNSYCPYCGRPVRVRDRTFTKSSSLLNKILSYLRGEELSRYVILLIALIIFTMVIVYTKSGFSMKVAISGETCDFCDYRRATRVYGEGRDEYWLCKDCYEWFEHMDETFE